LFTSYKPIKNQLIPVDLFSSFKCNLFLKREDLLHPFVSGNKFRKLKYNIEEAILQEKTTLLTFGGAYSNHISATAAAGKEIGMNMLLQKLIMLFFPGESPPLYCILIS